MLRSVLEVLSNPDVTFLVNIESIDTLPIAYDTFMIDFKQDIHKKVQKLINEIEYDMKKCPKDLSSAYTMEILITFYTYLLYYKTSIFGNSPGISIGWSPKPAIPLLSYIFSNSKKMSSRTLRIATNCMQVICLSSDEKAKMMYGILKTLIMLQFELSLNIFVHLYQVPHLLNAILEKNDYKEAKIIGYIVAHIVKIINETNSSEERSSIFPKEHKSIVIKFCESISNCSDIECRKANLLLKIIFIPESTNSFNLEDYLIISDMIPDILNSFSSDQTIDCLLTLLLSKENYSEVNPVYYSSLVRCVLIILARRPKEFRDVLSIIRDSNIFSDCFPILFKEIFSSSLLEESTVALTGKKEVSGKDNDENSELEDLDDEEKSLDERKAIEEMILDSSADILFNKEAHQCQIAIFESLALLPQNIDPIILKGAEMITKQRSEVIQKSDPPKDVSATEEGPHMNEEEGSNESSNESSETSKISEKPSPEMDETIPATHSTFSRLCIRLQNVLTLAVSEKFHFSNLLPEIVAALFKYSKSLQPIHEREADDLEYSMYVLKYAALISLINRKDVNVQEIIKDLGFEFETIDQSIFSFSELPEETECKAQAKEIMESRFNTLMNKLSTDKEITVKGLTDIEFKSVIVGFYALPSFSEKRSQNIDALISMIISPPTDFAVRTLTESMMFINASDLPEVTNQLNKLYITVSGPIEEKKVDPRDVLDCISSLLRNTSLWTNEIISSVDFVGLIDSLITGLNEENINSSMIIEILTQIIFLDQRHVLDDKLKVKIIETLIINKDLILRWPEIIINTFAIIFRVLDFKSIFRDDELGAKAISQTPHILDIIDRCISSEAVSIEKAAEAISIVCGFYNTAFNLAMEKLLSTQALIRRAYAIGLTKFLGTHQIPLIDAMSTSVGIFDILMIENKDFISSYNVSINMNNYSNIAENIYSEEFAKEVVEFFTRIQLDYNERDSNGDIKSETVFRGNQLPMMLISRYAIFNEERWIKQYFHRFLNKEQETKLNSENVKNYFRNFVDHYNGLVEAFPSNMLKILYYLSTYPTNSIDRRNIFQNIIFLRYIYGILPIFYKNEQMNKHMAMTRILNKAVGFKKGKEAQDETSLFETPLQNKLDELGVPIEYYHEIIGVTHQVVNALYNRAKNLYEKEGLNFLKYNKNAPVPITNGLMNDLRGLVDKLLNGKTDVEREAVNKFLGYLLELSIKENYEFPEKWNREDADDRLKALFISNHMARQSDSIKAGCTRFNNIDERKWFFIALNMISASSCEKESKVANINLLSVAIKEFGIECDYQIPSLIENFSGRVDSIAIRVSEGLAARNAKTAVIFLRQFIRAAKLSATDPKPLSVIVALLPWATAAGKDGNDQFITESINLLSEFLPGLENQSEWGRPASEIYDIIASFSTARRQTVEEILTRELESICKECLPEDQKKMDLITKMLVLSLRAEKEQNSSLYPSLLHSGVIGTMIYDTVNIRSLLHEIFCRITEIEQNNLCFIENKMVNGYECALQIADIIAEGRAEIKGNQKLLKELFLKDITESPIDQISIIGWMFTSVLTDFSDLPEIQRFIEEKDIAIKKSSESDQSFTYTTSQIEDFIKNTKPFTFIQRLTKINFAYPTMFNDIMLVYLKKHTGLKIPLFNKDRLRFENSVGDFAASIVLCFVLNGKATFKSFEDETIQELFSDSCETWDSKALPFFAYLIATRSDNLSTFTEGAVRIGKMDDLIKSISDISFENEFNLDEQDIDEIMENLSRNNALESVIGDIIYFAGEKECILKKASSVILTSLFHNPKVWADSKKILTGVLWQIYLTLSRNKSDEDFVKPIQAVLEWEASAESESLLILKQISSILKLKSNYDEEEILDFNDTFSSISEENVNDLYGAVFALGVNRIDESNIERFSKLLQVWMNTSVSPSVVKEIFSNQLLISIREMTADGIPSHTYFDAIKCMVHSKIISEEDASYLLDKACFWISKETMSDWCDLVAEMIESNVMDRINLIKYLHSYIEKVSSLITNDNMTMKDIKDNIKKKAIEINEMFLKDQNDSEIGTIISNIINNKETIVNARALKDSLSMLPTDNQKNLDIINFIENATQEIQHCVECYERLISFSFPITESNSHLAKLFGFLKIKKPRTLSEELFDLSFTQSVLKFICLIETELEINNSSSFQILFNLINSRPGVFLPIIYSESLRLSPMLKEYVSIVSHFFASSVNEPPKPILVSILEENNFEKLFDKSLEIEEIVEMISYLASTQMFEKLFELGERKLEIISDISESKSIEKFFTAMFIFLIRPVYVSPAIKESIDSGKINNILYYTQLPEGFLYYFNKLKTNISMKKDMMFKCFIKPFLNNPKLFAADISFRENPVKNANEKQLTDFDEFLDSVSRKHPLVAKFKYEDACQSRKRVIQILQKTGKVDTEYISDDEEIRFNTDYRIRSELSIYMKLASDSPLNCLAFLQKQGKDRPHFEITINGPSLDIFYENNMFFFWRYSGMIRDEDEVKRICHYNLTRHPWPHLTREILSFIMMKHPQVCARLLIDEFLDSIFRRNILPMLVMKKKQDYRATSQMRYIKLLYQLAQSFPGVFSNYGPRIVACCILSMSTSPSKWVKYARGLISQYLRNIETTCDEQREKINEKELVLLNAMDENDRHFDSIIQAAVEVFAEIGEEKLNEFASMFDSLSEFDYKFIYPAAVSSIIKLNELKIRTDDSLGDRKIMTNVISNILRNSDYYIQCDTEQWESIFSAFIEVLAKIVTLPCSANKKRLISWMSLIFALNPHQKIRMASLNLLANCIEKLSSDNKISNDKFVIKCLSHNRMIDLNTEFHSILTGEKTVRNFFSLFAICISYSLGYGDKETIDAANRVLMSAWSAWNIYSIPSFYILLPMATYSTLDVKEVAGKDFMDVFNNLIPELEKIDLMFIPAYAKCAARDKRCPRSRFSVLCPYGVIPIEKEKIQKIKDLPVKVLIPSPNIITYFFKTTINAIEAACDE